MRMPWRLYYSQPSKGSASRQSLFSSILAECGTRCTDTSLAIKLCTLVVKSIGAVEDLIDQLQGTKERVDITVYVRG